ncbi:hypothetical protein OAL13_00250 [bacterium]|nr:hypothetical protein [bacterium]
MKASQTAGFFLSDVRDKGRESQHSVKNEEGNSVTAHSAGMATADRFGRASDGTSCEACRRIHHRWNSPIRHPECREILKAAGALDEEGRPIRND